MNTRVRNMVMIAGAGAAGFAVSLASPAAGQLGLAIASKWSGSAGVLRTSPAETRVMIGQGTPVSALHVDGNFDAQLNKGTDSGGIRVSYGSSSIRIDDNEIMAVTKYSATSELPEQELGTSLHLNRQGGQVQLYGHFPEDRRITFQETGRVVIGAPTTQLASAKLVVGGTIGAKEIVVTPDGWADDVFEPDYRMKSIRELAEYVERNRHLPGIPSQAEVKSQGVRVGELNTSLLRNIEELTLRVIDQAQALEGQRQQHAHELATQHATYDARMRKLEVLVGRASGGGEQP